MAEGWTPHTGDHVIADIAAEEFPSDRIDGEGTIRIPATVVKVSGNEATVHLDAILVEDQGQEVTVPLTSLEMA